MFVIFSGNSQVFQKQNTILMERIKVLEAANVVVPVANAVPAHEDSHPEVPSGGNYTDFLYFFFAHLIRDRFWISY